MSVITNFLSNIDLNYLITIFDIQIALAVVIIAFLTRGIIARLIIGIAYKFTQNNAKPKESEMYAPIKNMFVVFAIYIALCIIPKGEFIAHIINEIFKVVIIIFITKWLTSFVHSDSKYLKKFFKKSENDSVNEFLCKILRGIIWAISIVIIIGELGFLEDLSGLITGLGLASAIIALAAQELVKNLLSRSINSFR